MKLGPQRRIQENSGGETSYWISFSDIMAGLLIIFILAALALLVELSQTRSDVDEALRELARAEEVRRNALQEMRDRLETMDISVEISDNESILRIPEDVISFETNQYRIPSDERMQEVVMRIGEVLYDVITDRQRYQYLDTIFIEGHTDRRPSSRQMGNWGLSTFRAISIWNAWSDHLDADRQIELLRNRAGKPLFSVSGYGATRPVQETQQTEADFQKNRRIDIRFTVRRPALEDFQNIQRLMDGGQ